MPKKVCLIVVPTFAGVLPRPFRNFLQIAYVTGRTCPDWKFAFLAPERSSLPRAMNEAGQMITAGNADCLIVFDDDCFPPYDCVPRLIAHYEAGKQFVAGVGIMRNFPHTTTVAKTFPEGYSLVMDGQHPGKIQGHQWLDDISKLPELASVDFCGVPVAMIARSALETVPQPWFGLHGEDGGVVSHDVFFCRKLKKAGIEVLVDTTIKCGHLAEAAIVTFENRSIVREVTEEGVLS